MVPLAYLLANSASECKISGTKNKTIMLQPGHIHTTSRHVGTSAHTLGMHACDDCQSVVMHYHTQYSAFSMFGEA